MSKGLFFQLAYTAARDLGDDSGTIENPFDLRRDRGRDLTTPTHRFTTALMYELPFGRGKTWMNGAPWLVDAALGGWQVSLVGYLQSGGFLTPTISMPDPTGTRFSSTATRPTVTIRPDQLRDPALDDPTIDRWYDVGAYAAPPIGRGSRAQPLALRVAQALPRRHWSVGAHLPHRADRHEHLQRTTVGGAQHGRDAIERQRRSHQRDRRNGRIHPAGRHADDAARAENGVLGVNDIRG
jgi:hypothetical protein